MKQIPLTQGKFAEVDDDIYDYLMQWKWYAAKRKTTCYAYRHISRKTRHILGVSSVAMQDVIMNTVYDSVTVDHINNDGLCNVTSNLRIGTQSKNMGNKRKSKTMKCTSQYKGVHLLTKKYHRKKANGEKVTYAYQHWYAEIKLNAKKIYIGYFKTELEAARAYDKKAIEIFKEFAKPNFPIEQSS